MWLFSALAPALYKGCGLLAAIILYGCVVVTTSAAKLLEDHEDVTVQAVRSAVRNVLMYTYCCSVALLLYVLMFSFCSLQIKSNLLSNKGLDASYKLLKH